MSAGLSFSYGEQLTDLSVDALREAIAYDPLTGVFTRKVSTSGRRGAAGMECGCLDPDGYVRIVFRGKRYMGHRLAWFYVHGVWPAGQIDHRDGIRTDNRIANLRDVASKTNTENMRSPTKRNRSGFLGVASVAGRFEAHIQVSGKRTRLGVFETGEAAHQCYLQAKREMHAGCTL